MIQHWIAEKFDSHQYFDGYIETFVSDPLGIVAPTFTGTIPGIEVDKDTGTHQFDYSSYFTSATSYSIAPAVEPGWSFNASTAVLTIDTDVANTFGSYVVTGTNTGGSDDSNAFFVTVAETAFSGGYFERDYYRPRFKGRTREEKKAAPIIERIAKKIAATPEIETSKDIELILHIQLEQEHIKYKQLYLTWIKREVKKEEARKKRKRRKQDEEIIMFMMLH